MGIPAVEPDFSLLAGRDPAGRETVWQVRKAKSPHLPESVLTTEWVVSNDGQELVRKTLPRPASMRTPVDLALAESLLDNEIRALVRLDARYPGARYPAELPKLAGYDFDSPEPFVLLRRYAGPLVGSKLPTLLTDERRLFLVSLFRALAQLAAVELVHGKVGPSSLCWEGSGAQLINLEHAVGAGERRQSGAPPAHPGDDVRAAGMVVYQLVTGRRSVQAGVMPDLSGQPPAIGALLRDVFAADPAQRPPARELLERLSAGDGLPVPADIDAAMRTGRQRFDAIRPQRTGAPTPQVAPAAPRPPRPSAGRRVPERQIPFVPLIILAVLIIATVVLLVVAK